MHPGFYCSITCVGCSACSATKRNVFRLLCCVFRSCESQNTSQHVLTFILRLECAKSCPIHFRFRMRMSPRPLSPETASHKLEQGTSAFSFAMVHWLARCKVQWSGIPITIGSEVEWRFDACRIRTLPISASRRPLARKQSS